MLNCKHCRNGFFDGRFGQDVECVNGILIDIDEAHEGASDVCHPLAPCHPNWADQQAGRDYDDDSNEDALEDMRKLAEAEQKMEMPG